MGHPKFATDRRSKKPAAHAPGQAQYERHDPYRHDPHHHDSYDRVDHTFPDGLPRSVRGQTPEMRTAIRRRQSTECARRKREKDAAERDYMERKYAENQMRIDDLERKINMLSAELMSDR